jgi:hypothetical protein
LGSTYKMHAYPHIDPTDEPYILSRIFRLQTIWASNMVWTLESYMD